MSLKIFWIVSLSLLISEVSVADSCNNWFRGTGLTPGKSDCLLKCSVALVDMNTFGCHESCAKLCDSSSVKDFTFQVTYLYPGLTTEERALAAQYPTEALSVFKAKLSAERSCAEIFGDNRTNDESDACRHYLWASYCRNAIGQDLTEKFLNAHEAVPSQSPEEKAMDVANNRLGLLDSEKLISRKKYSEREVIEHFQEALKKKEVVVLKPSVKK